MSQLINMIGLGINACGAALLIVFTSSGLNVGEKGKALIGFFINTPPDQRDANIRKYQKHKRWFRFGVVLLFIGYVFQLVATIFP
jgi:hypothetical protein